MMGADVPGIAHVDGIAELQVVAEGNALESAKVCGIEVDVEDAFRFADEPNWNEPSVLVFVERFHDNVSDRLRNRVHDDVAKRAERAIAGVNILSGSELHFGLAGS